MFFEQTAEISPEDYENQIRIWCYRVLLDITGSDYDARNTSALPKSDAQANINADSVVSNVAMNMQSDFAGSFEYVMTNFICKRQTTPLLSEGPSFPRRAAIQLNFLLLRHWLKPQRLPVDLFPAWQNQRPGQ